MDSTGSPTHSNSAASASGASETKTANSAPGVVGQSASGGYPFFANNGSNGYLGGHHQYQHQQNVYAQQGFSHPPFTQQQQQQHQQQQAQMRRASFQPNHSKPFHNISTNRFSVSPSRSAAGPISDEFAHFGAAGVGVPISAAVSGPAFVLPHHFHQHNQNNHQQMPSIQPSATAIPGLPIPPHFAHLTSQMAGTYTPAIPPSTIHGGASILTPEMTWSRVDLPAFVWFELFIRAGSVLSAAAVAANTEVSGGGPDGAGGMFFGWQGPVGVVAPDLMWNALRESLGRTVSFQQNQATANQAPTGISQSTNHPDGSNPLSSKTSSAAANNLTSFAKDNPAPTAASNELKSQGPSRPASSMSNHSDQPGHHRASLSRKSSHNPSVPLQAPSQKQRVTQPPPSKSRTTLSSATQATETVTPDRTDSSAALQALDALDVPIPALKDIPPTFLKALVDLFGVRGFCFHVGKPAGTVFLAQRGDGSSGIPNHCWIWRRHIVSLWTLSSLKTPSRGLHCAAKSCARAERRANRVN
ncbi:hypothetical protein BC830DRAFT_453087 [Chytriomyces sp. MP71]|nr:hypothetical protein BC830DRAFT_453087 [Chytriomyces sp. MP71]